MSVRSEKQSSVSLSSSVLDTAERLVQYCRDHQHREAIMELYSDFCVSHEMPGVPNEVVSGKAAIMEKNNRWFGMVSEFHSNEVSAPIVTDNYFVCGMTIDVTFKGAERQRLSEICLYEVVHGKIVSERFFYR